MGQSEPRFSTGVRFLDMELGGGIPVGDIVALTTPPNSQSELIFKEIARTQTTLYVSTICDDEEELQKWVEPSGYEGQADVTVTHVGPDVLLDDPDEVFEKIPSDSCVIIDPVNGLEQADRDQHLEVLNCLKDRLKTVDSIAIVHCLDGDENPENRTLTLKRADHVWQLRQTVDSAELTTSLLIPKSRGNQVLTEAISIELADEVRIDTSRNIA